MEPNQQKDEVVRLTFLESMLLTTVSVVFLLSLGLGVGFYLGTMHVTSNTSEVLNICQRAMDASDGRVKAIMTNYDMLQEELSKYQKFLVNVEKTQNKNIGGGP